MTESLHAAVEHRADQDRAPVEVDSESVPVGPVPVAGLVFGTALDGPGRLSGPIGRPGSVVEALRRQSIRAQVIRRSSTAVVMNLDQSTEDETEIPAAWEGTAKAAGQSIVGWLREEARNDSNYTVAVCNGLIYISKVGGVTADTELMGGLREHIKESGIDQRFQIYLCKSYVPSQASNHAEMCVVAALGPANLNNFTFFECTSPSCAYCAVFLGHYGVPNDSPAGDPASQTGWIHPFRPVAFGTQLGPEAPQVQELKSYLVAGEPASFTFRVGRLYTFRLVAGRCKHWLG